VLLALLWATQSFFFLLKVFQLTMQMPPHEHCGVLLALLWAGLLNGSAAGDLTALLKHCCCNNVLKYRILGCLINTEFFLSVERFSADNADAATRTLWSAAGSPLGRPVECFSYCFLGDSVSASS
jgi:hypothetical protein